MGLELTSDKYPPITSQTRYPLRHAASASIDIKVWHYVCGGGVVKLPEKLIKNAKQKHFLGINVPFSFDIYIV